MKITSLATAVPLLAAPALAVPANLIALYQFDSADASDSSGNGNDGIEKGGVSYTASFDASMGLAAQFSAQTGLSGINTLININYSNYNQLTMGAWVKSTDLTRKRQAILSHDNGGYDRSLVVDDRGDSAGADYAVFTGQYVADVDNTFDSSWVHLAVTYDGVTGTIYYNGVASETFTDRTTDNTSGYNLYIGTNPGFNQDFVGLMDDVFIFSSALSATEIADIYANGFSAVPLPAALPLLGAGLGLIGLTARRRK
ncbi:MAG: LamG domain-containing protein [Mangrovicoccus sp.]